MEPEKGFVIILYRKDVSLYTQQVLNKLKPFFFLVWMDKTKNKNIVLHKSTNNNKK